MDNQKSSTHPVIDEPPTFRYNHPKNYVGVPIAVAAPGDTGGLIQAYVVRGAGAARHGAEQLDLITPDDSLTATGDRVVAYACDEYGDLQTALDHFDTWRGTTTRFIDLDEGAWRDIAPTIVGTYPVVTDILQLLARHDDRLHLPELAHAYLRQWPDTARTVFVRGDCDRPTDDANLADRLYERETYRTAVTCQLKTMMYHAGLLTETGADSSHLIPETDVWELEATAHDVLADIAPEPAVTGGEAP